jgi:L-alanine-DL-glutamate epimerase-like enolase superfamily enzyme
MKIKNIKTYILRVPVALPITDAYFSHKARNHVFVEVSTDEGIIGLGEAGQYFGVSAIPPLVKEAFEPYLLGQDPLEVGKLWDTIYRRSMLYGRKGTTIIALSAVELALWDIIGKSANQPLYKLLGGKHVERVKAYASGGFYKPDVDLVKEMKTFAESGFGTVKMKVGFDPTNDVRRVKLVRKEVGSSVELAIDANMGYLPHVAKEVAQELEAHDIAWFEEPVSADDVDGMLEVRNNTRIRIAAGENEYTEYGFTDLIDKRAVDIIQADVTRCGGVSQGKEIAKMAARKGLLFAPHVFGSIVGLVASTHLIASAPNGYILEFDQTDDPLREAVIDEYLKLENGFVTVPERPGVGVEIPERLLRKYSAH